MTDAEARAYIAEITAKHPEVMEQAAKAPRFEDIFGYGPGDDEFHQGKVDRPRYLATSGRISTGFYRLKNAKDWTAFMCMMGCPLKLYDLTNYDWEKNSAHITLHKIADVGPGRTAN